MSKRTQCDDSEKGCKTRSQTKQFKNDEGEESGTGLESTSSNMPNSSLSKVECFTDSKAPKLELKLDSNSEATVELGKLPCNSSGSIIVCRKSEAVNDVRDKIQNLSVQPDFLRAEQITSDKSAPRKSETLTSFTKQELALYQGDLVESSLVKVTRVGENKLEVTLKMAIYKLKIAFANETITFVTESNVGERNIDIVIKPFIEVDSCEVTWVKREHDFMVSVGF